MSESPEALLADEKKESTDATATEKETTAPVDKQSTSEQQGGGDKTGEKTEDPNAEKKAEGESKKEPETEVEGAPEQYEFTVPEDMPEGFELDTQVVDALSNVLRDFNLPQAKAQKLVDEVWPVIQRRQEEQHAEMQQGWVEATKSDKEFGGDDFEKNRRIAFRGVDAYGNDALRELLKHPIHPELFRFFWKVGGTVSEDTHVGGKKGAKSVDLTNDAELAELLYGNAE